MIAVVKLPELPAASCVFAVAKLTVTSGVAIGTNLLLIWSTSLLPLPGMIWMRKASSTASTPVLLVSKAESPNKSSVVGVVILASVRFLAMMVLIPVDAAVTCVALPRLAMALALLDALWNTVIGFSPRISPTTASVKGVILATIDPELLSLCTSECSTTGVPFASTALASMNSGILGDPLGITNL